MSDHPTDLKRRSLLTGAAAAIALSPLVTTGEARGAIGLSCLTRLDRWQRLRTAEASRN